MDISEALSYLVVVWLAILGLYGMATSRNLVHLVVCLSVFQTSAWVLLLTIGFRAGATAPVYDSVDTGHAVVDPVMQAIAVTGIVVSAAVLALLLGIAVQVDKRLKTLDPDELGAIHG